MKITVTFTLAETAHVLSLFKDNKEEGVYYGPRQQYWDRHDRIVKLLEKATEEKLNEPRKSDRARQRTQRAIPQE